MKSVSDLTLSSALKALGPASGEGTREPNSTFEITRAVDPNRDELKPAWRFSYRPRGPEETTAKPSESEGQDHEKSKIEMYAEEGRRQEAK
jgi:hypothetical protein